mmetsp:Transcript_4221/g.12007  ORF Transcript_4221/g.12007 Transcript_4221/m.12007 type:complete len:209 (-) Transcript_4221:91-717(-)
MLLHAEGLGLVHPRRHHGVHRLRLDEPRSLLQHLRRVHQRLADLPHVPPDDRGADGLRDRVVLLPEPQHRVLEARGDEADAAQLAAVPHVRRVPDLREDQPGDARRGPQAAEPRSGAHLLHQGLRRLRALFHHFRHLDLRGARAFLRELQAPRRLQGAVLAREGPRAPAHEPGGVSFAAQPPARGLRPWPADDAWPHMLWRSQGGGRA